MRRIESSGGLDGAAVLALTDVAVVAVQCTDARARAVSRVRERGRLYGGVDIGRYGTGLVADLRKSRSMGWFSLAGPVLDGRVA